MRKIVFSLIICVLSAIIYLLFFLNNNKLELFKTEMPKGVEVDTIEIDKKHGIILIDVTKWKALGKFDNYSVIIKKRENGSDLNYKIRSKNAGLRFSREYIALVKEPEKAFWGWYLIRNGKLKNQLPGIDKFIDSIKSNYPKDFFISETNGYISVIEKGHEIREINYGNLITKSTRLNFDSLPYALYKLDNDTILIVSKNPEQIYNQANGVFFVPQPGFGVINRYKKERVYEIVDSISKLKDCPGEIHIEPN
jgi:hypothetical protein